MGERKTEEEEGDVSDKQTERFWLEKFLAVAGFWAWKGKMDDCTVSTGQLSADVDQLPSLLTLTHLLTWYIRYKL